MEAISHSVPDDGESIPNSDLAFWLMIQSLERLQDESEVVAQIGRNASDRALLAQQPKQQAEVDAVVSEFLTNLAN